MRLFWMKVGWAGLVVAAGVGVRAANPPAPPSTRPQPPLLPVPPLKSKIDYFRQLISANTQERVALLADKSQEHRQVLLRNVRRYEAMSPEERELNLRTLDLRFYLTTLLRFPASNRVARLPAVPEDYRSLVEARLRYWDDLPAELQSDLLAEEQFQRAMAVMAPTLPSAKIAPGSLSTNQIRQLDQASARWQHWPDARRHEVERNWERLFNMSEAEKKAQLAPLPLSPTERALMEKSLVEFAKLPLIQRTNCLKNFTKFAELSSVERRQFLRNAEAWQKMNPADRQAWRDFVHKVPPLPPLPPGFGSPTQPPRLPTVTLPNALATN